jgi:hypothetical protein
MEMYFNEQNGMQFLHIPGILVILQPQRICMFVFPLIIGLNITAGPALLLKSPTAQPIIRNSNNLQIAEIKRSIMILVGR